MILYQFIFKKKIRFTDIQKNLFKLVKSNEFQNIKKLPSKINDILI